MNSFPLGDGGRARRLARTVVAISVLVISAVLQPPAAVGAAADSATSRAGVVASSVTYDSYFVFDKNSSNPSNSTLTWYVYRTDLDPPRLTTHVSWRAGSGTGSTDDCYSNHGWLPNGYYKVWFDHDYVGTKIWGYVFALNNKICSKGTTTRTELFMHSEMTSSGGQYCPTSGDDPQCWDPAPVNDYLSNGCIKLNPTDIKSAAAYFLATNQENVTYSNKLIVEGG